MECNVSCRCGTLKGTAKVEINAGLKTVLVYDLAGWFSLQRITGTLHPVCRECGQPAMTKGDWR